MLGIGSCSQDGMVARGMETQDHLGFGRFFDPQALRANGDAAIAADSDEGGGVAMDELLILFKDRE